MDKNNTETLDGLVTSFAINGHVIVRSFLNSREIIELDLNVSRYVNQIVPYLPPTDVFYEVQGTPDTLKQMQFMEKNDPFFEEFMNRSEYTALAAALLGMAVVPKGVEFFNKPARMGKPTPPHQDGYYFCLSPSEALILWFPLDEVNEDNGCIRYVSGSHKLGIRPHKISSILGFSQTIADWTPQDEIMESRAIAKPGDVLAHHCNTIHRAEPNYSPRGRRAVAIVYYAAKAVHDPEAKARYTESARCQRVGLQSEPSK
jgi:phytanoyl-CoA hydroxylase